MLPGGWWRTGDMGFFDSKYQVYNLSGRSKDMIIRGGENIQPTEIENEICRFEPVQVRYKIS